MDSVWALSEVYIRSLNPDLIQTLMYTGMISVKFGTSLSVTTIKTQGQKVL